jgi:serine protease Do
VLFASIALVAVVGTSGGASADDPKKPVPVQTPAQQAEAFADTVDEALVRSVSSVSESSVAIWNNQETPGPDKRLVRVGGGSGVIVSWKGKGPYVITNEHVIKGATKIEVVPCDGTAYEAKLIDHVAQYDIALLEFVQPKLKVGRSAKLGKSEDLKEGQWVIATGNPFFLGADGHCVATLGVVSGLERTLRGEFTYANAIQHDAEVNPGNSGGPLWNLAGELVGINGMIATHEGGGIRPSNTGASFAIPLHLILRYFDDLLSAKVDASPGYLGLEVSDAKDRDGNGIGCRVDVVKDDSPAKRPMKDAKTGISRGDLITRLSFGSATSPQSHDIHCATDFVNALALYRAGERVRISFERTKTKMVWSGSLGGREPK